MMFFPKIVVPKYPKIIQSLCLSLGKSMVWDTADTHILEKPPYLLKHQSSN